MSYLGYYTVKIDRVMIALSFSHIYAKYTYLHSGIDPADISEILQTITTYNTFSNDQ